MPPLVNPEPHNVRSMEAWGAFRLRVHEWPLERLRERGEDLVRQHFADHDGYRDALLRYLTEADEHGDLADALIIAALRLGEITAFVSHPPSSHGYALERFSWKTYFKPTDALRAIEEGAAPRPLLEFARQTIERELANRPLFVSKVEASAFLRLKPPSEAQLSKVAMALVDEHLHAPLKKGDFIAALLERCPGCSAHRAGKAWGDHTPAAWRKPGRRPRA